MVVTMAAPFVAMTVALAQRCTSEVTDVICHEVRGRKKRGRRKK